MNGVHDMGGMQGLGPIAPEADEPVFHAPWEARALALTLAMGAWGRWSIDASRFARESIPGPDYLRMSYYEKWIEGLAGLMVERGLVSADELRTGRPDPDAAREKPAIPAEAVAGLLAGGGPATRDSPERPAFSVGEEVRARTLNPVGHTRLPRYVRGRRGRIVRDHGVHVFPDANAHGLGEQPRRLYAVRFAARELWGEAAGAGDAVHLDLWEPYLEPA